MDRIAVELINYSFRYRMAEEWVLKDINLKLHYGELMLLSGTSGEGKSTLLHSLNRIIPHIIPGEEEGELLIDEAPSREKKTGEISGVIGSVLQNADSQIINYIVEDEIAFGCENRNMEPERIGERIDLVCKRLGLEPQWFTRILSGGQKQRLITASILAMEQKILVFDEPLANLDLEGAHTLLKLLKELVREGYAILLIEHRLDVVLPYADTVYWLEKGSIYPYSSSPEKPLGQGIIKNEAELKKTEASKPCFRLEHMGYSVDGRQILKDLSFTLYQGERIVILGENGCGKTTFLRLLARLLAPSEGKLEQFLEPGRRRPSGDWYKKLGYVYQNPNYQLFMPTVTQEVAYQSPGDEITEEMVYRFGLEALRHRHPQSLSEGQKRRLTIACIMAMEPQVLLLDEPTVGQDYDGLKNIVHQLNALHEKHNNTMITITHDFRCARAFADRILWMKQGRLYKDGGPELAEEYFEELQTSFIE